MMIVCVWVLALVLGTSLPAADGQDQDCSSPLGVANGTVSLQQLQASSTAQELQLSFARFNCCTDQLIGAWCPAVAAAGEWLEVRLPRPSNVTALLLQVPVVQDGVLADGEDSPTLDTFSVFLELADSPPGLLTPYRGPANDTDEFTANYTAGVYQLDLGQELTVRRVRVQVSNFTTRPCVRLELLGCSAPEGLVPAAIEPPSVSLTYRSLEDMQLVCSLGNDLAFGIQYEVTWYMDDDNVSVVLLSDRENSAVYPVTSDSFSKMQTYRCAIAACYQPDCENHLAEALSSNVYRPEILLENSGPVNLEEGGASALINFTSTAPPSLFCVAGGQTPDCTVTVVAFAQDDLPFKCVNARILPQLLFPDGDQSKLCSVSLTNQNWRSTRSVTVSANQDAWWDGTTNSTVTLTVSLGNQNFYSVSDKSLMVEVSDKDRKGFCSSLSGARLITFDGTAYSNFNSGEFVLYRHTTLPYEVRVFYKQCAGGSLRCTCGAALRSDDDVILFTACRPGEGIRVQMFTNDAVQQGLAVRRYDDGDAYEVTLPTGAILVVKASGDNHLNVILYPSPLDARSTLGLCGSFDGNSTNDFHDNQGDILQTNEKNAFLQAWKVNAASSLYNGLCPADATSQEEPMTQEYSRCLSRDNAGTIPVSNPLPCRLVPGYDTDFDITTLLTELSTRPANCLSGIEDINPFVFNNTPVQQDDGSWPAGWNETYARQICNDTVTSSYVAAACMQVVTVNDLIPFVLDSCVENIRLSGSASLVADAVHVLEEECRHQVEANQIRWLPEGTPVSVLNTLGCGDNCSMHGLCQQGACVCDSGWAGVDCSVNATVPPTLTGLTNSLCNSLVHDCTSVGVYGLTFINTERLKCLAKPVTVNTSGYTETGEWSGITATYVSNTRVQCALTSAGNYVISVSNQDGSQSNALLYLTYNPACFSCDVTQGNCSQKVRWMLWAEYTCAVSAAQTTCARPIIYAAIGIMTSTWPVFLSCNV